MYRVIEIYLVASLAFTARWDNLNYFDVYYPCLKQAIILLQHVSDAVVLQVPQQWRGFRLRYFRRMQ
jgi:hypothetical protein